MDIVTKDRNIWVVRAGSGGVHADKFERQGVVALGWSDVGDLSSERSREDFKQRIRKKYPNWKDGRQINGASQLYRFVHELSQGDLVLTPVSDTRKIKVGKLSGTYRHSPGLIDGFPHTRPVDWIEEISRDELSVPARNSAGGALTLFSMNEHAREIERLLAGEGPVEQDEAEEEAFETALYEEVSGKADELISDKIAHMDPFDFEELVAAVLRAMGYHARVTDPGPDRGVDVVAHPDALGLENPRIKVQVKQRNSRAGSRDMRDFIGTLRDNERGIFVSTGGFSSDAKEEALRPRAGVSVTTVDRDRFVELLTEHYEDLSPNARALIPLRNVYIPVD